MLHLLLKPHRESLKAGTVEVQKIFALLKVIPEARVAQARPPLAFVLVMDTSGSMREAAATRAAASANNPTGSTTKLDRMIEAGHAFMDDERLRPGDGVAVVRFDDEARVLLPLTPLADKKAAHAAIESLRQYSGSTKMAQGLRRAATELDSLPAQVAKRVLLLTDGQTFDEPECRPLAVRFAEANTPLIAIGIGAEYNEDLLRDLAQISGGRPYHLQDMTRFREVLDAEVSTSVREVVTDLQATVSCVRGVTLDSVTRVYPSLAEVGLDSQPLRLGNVAAGDYTVFTLELTVSGLARPASRARLVRLELSGSVPGLNQSGRANEDGMEQPASQELVVSFTADEAAVADVDAEVLGYVQQRNVDRLVQNAVRQAANDSEGARRTLHSALGLTHRINNPVVTKMLQDALDELDKTGAISSGTRKTIALSGRTRTVKTVGAQALEGLPSEEQIRKMTGA